MKAIKNLHLENVATDIRRNLNSINAMVNNDTKHLSKLLTAERGVWNSLSTLTYEQSEAAKYLTIWGKSEGVDLSDITEKFGFLIAKLSEVEGVLADRYTQYRGHLKDIRAREESMKEQRLKKETLWNKIEKEERKAKRSESAELKLKDFHKDLEKIEKETIAEETALADFKRQKLRAALLLQVNALLEFGEKIVIISNYSRDILEQIPMETTSPGEPRKTYTGQEKTSQATSDASAALSAWTPKPRPSNLAQINPPITTSDIDLPSSVPPTGFIVPTPPKGTPNSENTDFTFGPSNRKPVGGSSLAISDDSNEADHSDLDHSEVEVEVESNKDKSDQKTKFVEIITTPSIDNEESESIDPSCSIVPRPPTPPKAKTDSDSEQEKIPSITIKVNEQDIKNDQKQKENSLKHVHFSDVENEIP